MNHWIVDMLWSNPHGAAWRGSAVAEAICVVPCTPTESHAWDDIEGQGLKIHSGNLTWLLKMVIYVSYTHEKC